MQNISFSKPHRLLTNGRCLTTCSINFQNWHLTTQTWVWMSVLKRSPARTNNRQRQGKSCSSFSHADHTDIYSGPASYSYDSLHTRPPPKPQTTPNTTAEYMETLQQMARNCTIPTSNLPLAPFLCQPWKSSVYTEFNADYTWGTHSRNST